MPDRPRPVRAGTSRTYRRSRSNTAARYEEGGGEGATLHALRWRGAGQPDAVAVYAATPGRLAGLEITELASNDPSGARGLITYAASVWLRDTPENVIIEPATRATPWWRGPRPGRARLRSGAHRNRSGEHASATVWVSIARSPGLVVAAVARRRVGVDVEAVQTRSHADELLPLLHAADHRALARLRGARRQLEITAAWVRKEALLKATGTGLSRDPARDRVGSQTNPQTPHGWRSASAATVPAPPPTAIPMRPRQAPTFGTHVIGIAWRPVGLRAPARVTGGHNP
jgi:hypothetical protein